MPSNAAFLIDGTAFCYRAFHAIPSLSTSDGRPTNAVYGFVMMLNALREKQHPDYLAVAFDTGKPTFRHKAFEDYKVQRKPMPEPLIGQLPLIKQLLVAYRIPLFEQEGYEAEDILATIARRIAQRGIEVFLVTGDKDALQLVNAHIKVYNPHKDDAVLDADAVRARYGIGPDRMLDLMALMGDDIDNIPGVPGIGEKTASQLLQQFGSLEALYQRLDEVSAARRNSLKTHREQVQRSRELARVRTDVPLDISPDALAIHEPDWRALRALFRDLGFKKLLRQIEAESPSQGGTLACRVRVVGTGSNAREFTQWLSQVNTQPVAVVCWYDPAWLRASWSEHPSSAVLGLGGPEDAWVMPVHPTMFESASGRVLRDWLSDPVAPKLSHNAKALLRLLGCAGVELKGLIGDTMLAAYLLNPARTSPTINDLSDEYLQAPLGPLPKLEGAFDQLVEVIEPFGYQAAAVSRLHELLLPKLETMGLGSLYVELELPLVGVLARMEATGVALDLRCLAGLRASMEGALNSLIEEISRLAGTTFNLNSPKQLAQVLFERLLLPVVKRTKTGPSTDSDVLQQLATRHPLPEKLIRYRELSKLVSTYLDALPKLVNPATGRIHTSFNQAATATGRLSSSDPNLQNIPVKTELGRSIRKAFIPGIPDGLLVAADYSQIELRILAHLSGDEQLAAAFREGRDIHRFTASLIYGCSEDAVQPKQRNAMKAVNYGILYGMTSHGLSKELGVPFEEAQAFITAYFDRYPRIRAYLDAQIEQATCEGFVQTLLGRRRYIPELKHADPVIRQFGERMAVNAPIQGTAADLIKQAMVRVTERLTAEGLKSRMVLQVHDELVFEAPREELRALASLVRSTMEGAIALRVPLAVTLKAGPNWLDLSELKPNGKSLKAEG